MKKTAEVRLLVSNSGSVAVTFVLEPWGETYPLAAPEQISLVAREPEGRYPQVDFAEGEVMVWRWPGSTVRIFTDDEELGASRFAMAPVPENALPPIEDPTRG